MSPLRSIVSFHETTDNFVMLALLVHVYHFTASVEIKVDFKDLLLIIAHGRYIKSTAVDLDNVPYLLFAMLQIFIVCFSISVDFIMFCFVLHNVFFPSPLLCSHPVGAISELQTKKYSQIAIMTSLCSIQYMLLLEDDCIGVF